jgi:hypothetical protein
MATNVNTTRIERIFFIGFVLPTLVGVAGENVF